MLTSRLFCVTVLCLLLGMTSAMAGIVAIDEDFDGGGLFVNRNGTEPTTVATTVQGVNIQINPSAQNPAYNWAGNPIVYVDDPAAGAIATIDATHKCYQLNATKTLQFGTMIGTTATQVNGNIPSWGDGNCVVQAALATNNSTALLQPNGTVVGKMEVAYNGLALTNVANLRKIAYELRVDTANSQIDVYVIKNDGTPVKVLDGANSWAALSTVIYVRGLATDVNASRWAGMVVGGQRGPTSGTVLATNAAGDSARVSAFVNSNTPTTADAWTASNADGRLAIDGKSDGRVMGIKFTAGATVPLFIDNIFCTSEGFTYADYPASTTTPSPVTNKHSRLNPFTELVQGVPSGGPAPTPTPTPGAPGAGVDTWEIYY